MPTKASPRWPAAENRTNTHSRANRVFPAYLLVNRYGASNRDSDVYTPIGCYDRWSMISFSSHSKMLVYAAPLSCAETGTAF